MRKWPEILRVGTRGSQLALTQTNGVCARLRKKFPALKIEVQILQTSGDRFSGQRLAEAGGKGLFVKEIEEALLEGRIDMAVHSLKDLPGVLPEGLRLACYPEREDPRDAFVSKKFPSLRELPEGGVVGTASPRREAQLRALRPDLKIEPIRGNVDTRLKKVEEGLYDAVILAAAGLKRLEKEEVIREYFATEFFIPAIGQGILGVEVRSADAQLCADLHEALGDEETGLAARAERSFLQAFGGDCYTPLGAHARLAGGRLEMAGFFSDLAGKKAVRATVAGPKEKPEELGRRLKDEISRHQGP